MTLAGATRTALSRVATGAAVAVELALLPGCSYGLHNRRILEGRPFSTEAMRGLRAGATEAEVLAAVGEPIEVQSGEGGTLWRYYERAQLRGCRTTLLGFIRWDTPVLSREAKVHIQAGVVQRVELTKQE